MAHGQRPKTAIVGAGRLARAFLPQMCRAGYPVVAVASRRLSSARAACRLCPPARPTTDPAAAVAEARLVLLAVPDRSIEPVAQQLAESAAQDWRGRVVLHHAGALGPEPLGSLQARGAAVAVLHPLQCLGAGRGTDDLLAGSRARIEGDAPGLRAARRLARDLGLVPLRFPHALGPRERAAYHAAAALLANDFVALTSLAVELLESTGLDRRSALRALAPLARGTLSQLETGGLAAALTGPVPRGDARTLRQHLARLARISPEAAEAHRLFSRRLARVAEEEGVLSAADTRSLLRRIGPGWKRGL